MSLSSFLAVRYLRPKRTFVSVITLISVAGVALGVWLLTVVMAVFTGYGDRIKENILGFQPHLVVESGGVMEDWLTPLEALERQDWVVSATPLVRGQVIVEFNGRRLAPIINGILQPEDAELRRLNDKIAVRPSGEFDDNGPILVRQGEFNLTTPYDAVIGDDLANAMGIEVGSTLLLYAPRDMNKIMDAIEKAQQANGSEERNAKLDEVREMTVPQEVEITGLFDSGYGEVDGNTIFLNLETAQILYQFDLDDCHSIAVKTDDPIKVDYYRNRALVELGQGSVMAMEESAISRAIKQSRDMLLVVLVFALLTGFLFWKAKNDQSFSRVRYLSFGVLSLLVTALCFWPTVAAFLREQSNTEFFQYGEGGNLGIMTWMDRNANILNAVAVERQMMFLILFIVMIVGAFSIMNTMITFTVQKQKDIGVIKSLGATEGQIANIFFLQGTAVGMIGVTVGLIIGQLTIRYRNELSQWVGQRFNVDFFNQQIYQVDGGLPAKQTLGDILTISIGAFVCCALAALVPALIAASLQPAKALRSD